MSLDQPEQRTVSANGAPPAAAAGAINSPFAMGSRYLQQSHLDPEEQSDAIHAERGQYLMPRARKVLESCGPLTEEQLAEGLGEPVERVRRLVKNGIAREVFERATDAQGNQVVQLKPPRGLKTFLAKKGGQAATKRGAKSTPAKKPAPSTRKPVSHRESGGGGEPMLPAVAVPEAPPEFACGLLNTGVLVLEIAGKETRLKKAWVRDLVAYLDRIGSNSPEGMS